MRIRRIALLLTLGAGLIPGATLAREMRPEPDAALAEMRAGFVTAGGLTFNLAISVNTFINGQLALNTTASTVPTVPTAPTAPTGPTAPTAPGAVLAALTVAPAGVGVSSPLVVTTSPAPAPTTPAPTTPAPTTPAPAPASGAAVVQTVQPNGLPMATTADGGTIVIPSLSAGQLTTLVLNSADYRTIQQNTQVDITLPGFAGVQQNQLLAGVGMHIGQDGALGFVGSLSH
jgi:hypothetical protein